MPILYDADQIETRAMDHTLRVSSPDSRQIRGRPIVFNSPSQLLRERGIEFFEIIRSEAVDRSLRQADEIIANFNHDDNKVLGNSKSGTLRMTKTMQGLEVVIDAPDPTDPANLIQLINRGDIHGMSFRFLVTADGEEWDRSTRPYVRAIHDMTFSDVSIVVRPAYLETNVTAAVRSLRATFQMEEDGFIATQRAKYAAPLRWMVKK